MTGEPHIATDGAEADPLEGRTIGGKFEIEHLLGSGAMGKVYKARQVALDRPVAIKVMHRQLEQDANYAARFDREAKAASRLDHPNLIRVLDYGREPDGLFYIAMEFLDGRDLFQVLERDWPLPPARIVELLSQTLAGLAAAHDAGVLHRDLKPENIMLLRRKSDDGTSVDAVKVCDFGIAKMVNAPQGEIAPTETRARTHTTAGFLVGTPEFMSPEQAHGQDLDGRSDVYSVGVILYQLLSGRLPFEAATPLGVVLKVLHEEPSRPSEHVQGELNRDLEDLCMKAIEKDPKDRFADAREMRSAILSIGHDAGYLPPIRTARASLANAPTMDFAPERAEGSLGPQEVPKPATRGRVVGIMTVLAGVLAVLFVFRGRLLPQQDASAAIVTPPPTTTASPLAVAEPEIIAPLSATPQASADPPQIPLLRKGHQPFGKRPATPADPPTQPAPSADPPPTATVPPPETAVTPPPSPAVTTAPSPTAIVAARPTFDASTAHVDLGTPSSSGVTPINVTRALSPVSSRITACYRAALNASNAGATSANLHVGTNEDGVITDARVSGMPAAASQCIENEVRGRKIANVDTGNAMADVPLALKPR